MATGLYSFEFTFPVGATDGAYFFQENEGFLTGKIIRKIWYNPATITGQTGPSGNKLIIYSNLPGLTNDVSGAWVTILDDSGRQIVRLVDPLTFASTGFYSGVFNPSGTGWEFPAGTKINWSRFEVDVFGLSALSVKKSLIFLVEYEI